jgi:hypothetical protein
VTRQFYIPFKTDPIKTRDHCDFLFRGKTFNFERLQAAHKHSDPKLISAYGTAETELKKFKQVFRLENWATVKAAFRTRTGQIPTA